MNCKFFVELNHRVFFIYRTKKVLISLVVVITPSFEASLEPSVELDKVS